MKLYTDTYIPDTNQKVEIYKRIAGLASLSHLGELEEELWTASRSARAGANLMAVAKSGFWPESSRSKQSTSCPDSSVF